VDVNPGPTESTASRPTTAPPPRGARRGKAGFSDDFRRFFVRGLAALLPTLITLWLLIWFWQSLWEYLGRHIIFAIKWIWATLIDWGVMEYQPVIAQKLYWERELPQWVVQVIGVGLAILLVYIVGLFVGNLIGRTVWRLAEMAVMRIPLVRAIYPAVKQVTDFLLAERTAQFQSSRVVAVAPHANGIWSIGLVTGVGLKPVSDATGEQTVTVFIPSSPTAFSGYVVVVPRAVVVELPMTVEEAMRLLVSGGVLAPPKAQAGAPAQVPAAPVAPAAAAAPVSAPVEVAGRPAARATIGGVGGGPRAFEPRALNP
jgi:uncharacterized membrane protein